MELGTFENQTVRVVIFLSHGAQGESLGLYGMNNEKMKSFCENAKGAPIKVDGNRLTTVYEAEKDGYLLLPLPMRKGYTFRVNGQETKPEMWAGCLVAIPVFKGENQVEAVFWPQGLRLSLLVFAAGVLVSLCWMLYHKKWEQKNGTVKGGRFWIVCVTGAFIGALIWGYLVPLAVWLLF